MKTGWLFLVGCLISSMVFAMPSRGDLEEFYSANERLSKVISQSLHEGSPLPASGSEELTALVGVLSDENRYIHVGYTTGSMEELIGICQTSAWTTVKLMLSGIGLEADPSMSTAQLEEKLALIDDDALLYEKELESLVPFMHTCSGEVLAILDDLVAENPRVLLSPEARQALSSLRTEIADMYLYVFQWGEYGSEELKTVIASTLSDNSANFAASLPVSERHKIVGFLKNELADATPEQSMYIEQAITDFESDECVGLCSL